MNAVAHGLLFVLFLLRTVMYPTKELCREIG
jgi:hypothetical protein